MTMTTKELLALVDSFPEANISNYGDDEVVALNDWGCQMVDATRALCAEVEALRKDAERYRWLKANVSGGSLGVPGGWIDTITAEWDAAIDAARSRNEHEG